MYPHISHKTDQHILELQHVSVLYENLPALENVTFHLLGGERVAIAGPNGAGKSTLLKVIAGVLKPTMGTVSVFGSVPNRHVCIGYVPQRTQVDWRFPVSVADVVMMGRIAKLGLLGVPRRKDWEYVHASLETVGIADLHKRQINELSGGQQQRMFIARALAQEAELMLMDEPLSGLDLPAQESLLGLIGDLQKKQATIMVATHDLEQARRYFDRILLLNHRVIGFGSAQDVLTPEKLLEAYGARMRLAGSALPVDDCCHGEDEGGSR